ncbi:MAG: hypothetical protein CVU14_10030 [Bacteroidetes bacterium HGW-Bacteroidetes-9]|jgi:hypothetical protein|nr:MAG: hypothetical protein CVU14_10030 [Bacteroidetes bacterium HGW-Bacteroidetes-9]
MHFAKTAKLYGLINQFAYQNLHATGIIPESHPRKSVKSVLSVFCYGWVKIAKCAWFRVQQKFQRGLKLKVKRLKRNSIMVPYHSNIPSFHYFINPIQQKSAYHIQLPKLKTLTFAPLNKMPQHERYKNGF